jgi:hypothetical protein
VIVVCELEDDSPPPGWRRYVQLHTAGKAGAIPGLRLARTQQVDAGAVACQLLTHRRRCQLARFAGVREIVAPQHVIEHDPSTSGTPLVTHRLPLGVGG